MRSDCFLFLVLILVVGFLFPQPGFGQLSTEYYEADRLLKEQQFEEAAQKFESLYNDEPTRYLYLEKLTESLINLKEYERAISVLQKALDEGRFHPRATIRLGELVHISGDNQKALEIWEQVLKEYKGDQQAYLNVARSMKERRVFDKSIETFKKLRSQSAESNLVTSELAETYMQAGEYENAMKEFLQLVEQNPDRLTYVQRRLMRSQDDQIYDVAILEIDDFLDDLSADHPSYRNLQQLEIWLLMERKLFDRAFATAKKFENQSSTLTYSVYNLGSKLVAEEEFELAEQAYQYYIDNNIRPLIHRSRENLADVYIQWAKHLEDYNLDLSTKRNTLYQQAFDILNTLRTEVANYPRIDQVLVTLSELSLDVLHEPDKASIYLDELQRTADDSLLKAQKAYIEGRLYLYDDDYTRARVAFSKSNKQERIGDLAEKNRYYLALTDFFSGDYEFAKIQLNALERQSTSYYANDAVQLRLWIQNGLKADSTGQSIEPFAKTIAHFSRGEDEKGIEILKNLLGEDRYNPLLGHALLEINAVKENKYALFVYQAISAFLKQQGSASPLQERLMWEKARLADQIITNEDLDLFTAPPDEDSPTPFEDIDIEIPKTAEQLISLYEELLQHFPNGFYATYARERLQELENTQV
ncbi:MAG: tetratricopeptide repeat protein [Bacteroidota bacterium]